MMLDRKGCGFFSASGALALILLITPAASAQWSTGFFNTNDGWVRNIGFVGQNTSDPSGDRWQGNDPYNPITETGETDSLAFATGYTPGGSQTGNSSLIQGGAYLFADIFPGTSTVSMWRSFTPIGSSFVSFAVEWSLIGSLDPGFANLDTFAFGLRDASNTQSLLELTLTPGINVQPNSYTLQSIVSTGSGLVTNTIADLGYQAVFQMVVDITGSSYDLSISQINAATRSNINTFNLVSGAAISEGLTAQDFGTVGIDWNLTSGDPANPGSNYIIVNEVTVVPEPSTWALLAATAALTAIVRLRRRRA
jgi:hypothetical protein